MVVGFSATLAYGAILMYHRVCRLLLCHLRNYNNAYPNPFSTVRNLTVSAYRLATVCALQCQNFLHVRQNDGPYNVCALAGNDPAPSQRSVHGLLLPAN